MWNTGHGIVFRVGEESSHHHEAMVNISGGPLTYNYPVYSVAFHFGLDDASGSEHAIAGRNFVGEVSMFSSETGYFRSMPPPIRISCGWARHRGLAPAVLRCPKKTRQEGA